MGRKGNAKRKAAATSPRRVGEESTAAKNQEPTANTPEVIDDNGEQLSGLQAKIFQWRCTLGCRCCVACQGLTAFAEKNGRLAGIQEIGWLRWIASVNHNTGLPFKSSPSKDSSSDSTPPPKT